MKKPKAKPGSRYRDLRQKLDSAQREIAELRLGRAFLELDISTAFPLTRPVMRLRGNTDVRGERLELVHEVCMDAVRAYGDDAVIRAAEQVGQELGGLAFKALARQALMQRGNRRDGIGVRLMR